MKSLKFKLSFLIKKYKIQKNFRLGDITGAQIIGFNGVGFGRGLQKSLLKTKKLRTGNS